MLPFVGKAGRHSAGVAGRFMRIRKHDTRALLRSIKRFIRERLPGAFVSRYSLWRARRAFTEPELRLLPALPSGGCFLDVGANIGIWSIEAARFYPRVHAFEPDHGLAERLRRTMPRNVEIHNVALSNRAGIAPLATPISNGEEITTRASLESQPGVGTIVRDVTISTLDDLDLHGISVIKIDVEGHEASVLEGAAVTIAREHPVLIVEIEDRHHPGKSQAIFEFLFRLGYDCVFVQDGHLEHFDLKMLDELQGSDRPPAPGQKAKSVYIYNFVFVPHDRGDVIEAMTRRVREISKSD